jgi:hypothetical protein
MLPTRTQGGHDMSTTGRILLGIVMAVLFLSLGTLEVLSGRVRIAPTGPGEGRTVVLVGDAQP